MKKCLVVLAILFSLFISAGLAYAADPALPDQTRPDEFPGIAQYNPVEKNLTQMGIVWWSYSMNKSCSGSELNDTVNALNDISQRFGVFMVYDPNATVAVRVYGNCGTDFAAVCGDAINVIGCLGRGYPYNLTIDLNMIMVAYYPESRFAILLHEIMHALLTWNEQYGYGGIVCIPGWRDFMNCGVDSRHGFEYIETQRWARTAGPAGTGVWSGRFSDGTTYIWWCDTDPKATRVAIMGYNLSTGAYRWTGEVGPVVQRGCQGWVPKLEQGEVPCVNFENMASIVVGRNDNCDIRAP